MRGLGLHETGVVRESGWPFASVASAVDAWLMLIEAVVESPSDIPTLATWADLVATSVGTLRRRCYLAGVSPRRSLCLARLLRAVICASGERWNAVEWLRCADQRTLRSLLRQSGLPLTASRTPSASRFLSSQTLLGQHHPTLQALRSRFVSRRRRTSEFPLIGRRRDGQTGPCAARLE